MSTQNQKVGDIMIPISDFPCMRESGTVLHALKKLRSFCPLNSSAPCGFSELMVVDGEGELVGRVTQQGILRVLFSSLLDSVNIRPFEGRVVDYSDLAILLDEVLTKEGIDHLNSSVDRVIERDIRILPPSTELMHAMAIMVLGKETVLPVVRNGKLVGVVKLVQILGLLGDKLISLGLR